MAKALLLLRQSFVAMASRLKEGGQHDTAGEGQLEGGEGCCRCRRDGANWAAGFDPSMIPALHIERRYKPRGLQGEAHSSGCVGE